MQSQRNSPITHHPSPAGCVAWSKSLNLSETWSPHPHHNPEVCFTKIKTDSLQHRLTEGLAQNMLTTFFFFFSREEKEKWYLTLFILGYAVWHVGS